LIGQPMPAIILVCENDTALLNSRCLVLALLGATVKTACTVKDILAIPSAAPIALAVIGHGVEQDRQFELGNLVGERWAAAKILYLVKTHDSITRISGTEYVCGSQVPKHLIEACRELLN
jgi:hypothetical protein